MIMLCVLIVFLLLLLVWISMNSNENIDSYDKESKNTNINEKIQKAYDQYKKDLSHYNIGAKGYKYDFIDNEQPLNGLSPNYEQNYPSTLKKSNKMIVDQDLTVKYVNLLNTKNNSLKYYNNS